MAPAEVDLLVISEAPGNERAEQFLNKIILEVMPEKSVRLINVIKTELPGNRVPTEIEIDLATDELFTEIYQINPRFIMTVGKTAYKALADPRLINRQLNQVAGIIIKHTDDDDFPRYLHSYHPNYCFARPEFIKVLRNDFLRIKKYLDKYDGSLV